MYGWYKFCSVCKKDIPENTKTSIWIFSDPDGAKINLLVCALCEEINFKKFISLGYKKYLAAGLPEEPKN